MGYRGWLSWLCYSSRREEDDDVVTEHRMFIMSSISISHVQSDRLTPVYSLMLVMIVGLLVAWLCGLNASLSIKLVAKTDSMYKINRKSTCMHIRTYNKTSIVDQTAHVIYWWSWWWTFGVQSKHGHYARRLRHCSSNRSLAPTSRNVLFDVPCRLSGIHFLRLSSKAHHCLYSNLG